MACWGVASIVGNPWPSCRPVDGTMPLGSCWRRFQRHGGVVWDRIRIGIQLVGWLVELSWVALS